MIRVLIVEGSAAAQQALMANLVGEPTLAVVGLAADGDEAVRRALALRPDLILLDLALPKSTGCETARRIMEVCPTPIVALYAQGTAMDPEAPFRAIQMGVLEVVVIPTVDGERAFAPIRDRLLITIKLMAEVKVIRRRAQKAPAPIKVRPVKQRTSSLVVIGASTGGPVALNTLLRALPRDFPLPIVVVQHMSSGFTQALVGWLRLVCSLPVHVAEANQRLAPGEVYFAPEDHHLLITKRGTLSLNQAPLVSFVRPSATVLFQSAAQVYGSEAIGLVLSGMGDDGALGLRAIHERGGATLVQDEATSVVYGMPRAAVELGAADQILPLEAISSTLLEIVAGNARINV